MRRHLMTVNKSVQTRAGQWIGGYQAVSPAPLSYIQGSRSRPLGGHLITGSWSDPWWMYSSEHGWAVAKHWRNRATKVFGWSDGHSTMTEFPARDEVVLEATS